MTSIEWTDATWNPVTGCSKVSAGCKNCYAEGVAHRFWGTHEPTVVDVDGAKVERPRRFTDVRTHADRLDEPLRWRKPRRVFVNSMSDLFHEDVPDAFIDRVFGVMALSHYVGRCRRRNCDHEGFACDGHIDDPTRHTFQVLTKRPERMRDYLLAKERRENVVIGAFNVWKFSDDALADMEWPLPNVWLGVSVEDQRAADERIPLLLETPAAVRFLSCEPLLGPVDIRIAAFNGADSIQSLEGIGWSIVGGESGPGARPCRVRWVRSIVEQCKTAGVPVFVKQLGAQPVACDRWDMTEEQFEDLDASDEGWSEADGAVVLRLRNRKGGDPAEWPEDLRVREFPVVNAQGG